ncbi:ATP-dependent helicase/deoxyribonuclease subunit B [Aquicella siphonis]|uniref:ATP-dependent helicase/deoxyribonuclease subunit B n=1 Tax=Aquicella siphonis TaxID=254247 RepID=A0A5E4PGJ0_9COXI|nr:PD-(D/E)XK nuclease family protein [Aquicella siphonis]VVC76089.1 ATP-dependent helicase/deoxyribonuclease subunit B [Aquicella siphonis]
MSKHFPQTSFFKNLRPGTVVLTPNRRLSATLHKLYQQYQLNANNQVWETPDILPLSSWIHSLWNNYCADTTESHPLILNSIQEHYLWEKILISSRENDQLLQVSETAKLAKSAWRLLNEWQVDIHDPCFGTSEDYAALRRWIMKFQQLCLDHHWIDHASLIQLVMDQIIANAITPPAAIYLYGFTEYSPQLQRFLKACENAGSRIYHEECGTMAPVCRRISLPDQENEIQTMARWAKAVLANQGSAAIGCVIPSLDKMRDRVAQIFSEVFADPVIDQPVAETTRFNISAGKSLAQYPVINSALLILSLHKKNIPIETMSYLLATPFMGDAEYEHVRRASFDSRLRQHNKSTYHLGNSAGANFQTSKLDLKHHCPCFAKRIQQYLDTLDNITEPLTYAEWANVFSQLLTVCGWPGERSLNSEEYQVTETWLELLVSMGTLDTVSTPANFTQAWHALQKMTADTVFQPHSPEAPIQVLGMLEAAAMPFDYLWVTGMDDTAWPQQPHPHPFIPKRIQRELRMPHATAERELTFCKSLLNQYIHSAQEVVFSHADKNDELEMQPSPLIREIKSVNIEDLSLAPFIPPDMRIFLSRQIDIFYDEQAPAVTAEERIHGGVSVIKQQALCPFKSFAEWRLHAHALETPLPGLRSKDRGTLIHKAMEIIWNQLEDQSRLIAMDNQQLNELIENSIVDALNTASHSHSEFTQYMTLEKKRLQKLISGWLDLEKTRPPFKVINNEKNAVFNLGQLALNIRIDRIDQLGDGNKLIIDYKTGKQNDIAGWFSDRPEEPQLPLYSLLDPEHTCSIAFAQIHPGEYVFKGISRYALDMPGIRMITEIKKTTALSWGEQISQWNETLNKLSADFCLGDARVDPKDPPQTCNWCALHPLCRINEEIHITDAVSPGTRQP